MIYLNNILLLLFTSILLASCTQTSNEKAEAIILSTGEITIDGTSLKYVVEGEGQPCLVIGSSVYYPRTISLELRKHFKFYFVDLRWFAETYKPVDFEQFTLETITSDIERIRQELKLEKPMILGHSIHGTIALEYAKRYPEHISSVVVIGSPSTFGTERFETAFTELWETASEERKSIHQQNLEAIPGSTPDTDKGFIDDYIATTAQYWYDPTYDARWLWEDMTIHTELTNHLFGNIFGSFDMFEGEWNLSVPVLLIMGAYDYVIPFTLWEENYDQIPDFTRIVFDQSGHTPQLEESDKFDQQLLEWSKSH